VGPKGDKGEPGPQGTQGIQGPIGPVGPAGASGTPRVFPITQGVNSTTIQVLINKEPAPISKCELKWVPGSVFGILDITLNKYYQDTSVGIYMANKITITDFKQGLKTALVILKPIYGYNVTKGIRGDYDSADGTVGFRGDVIVSTSPNVVGSSIKLVVPVVYTGEDFVKEVG
jgi:hypothetical protein